MQKGKFTLVFYAENSFSANRNGELLITVENESIDKLKVELQGNFTNFNLNEKHFNLVEHQSGVGSQIKTT